MRVYLGGKELKINREKVHTNRHLFVCYWRGKRTRFVVSESRMAPPSRVNKSEGKLSFFAAPFARSNPFIHNFSLRRPSHEYPAPRVFQQDGRFQKTRRRERDKKKKIEMTRAAEQEEAMIHGCRDMTNGQATRGIYEL